MLALWIVFLLLSLTSALEKASFFGASMIAYPLQEAKSITDISFRFRTQQSDALIILAAGKTDYCLVKLENARVKLHLNLGAGENELSSPKGITFNDLKWHHVTVIRREANITLRVDHTVVIKILPGKFFELNIHYGIFLGSQGDFSELFLGHMESFRGCLDDVNYNGVSVIEKARSRSSSVRVDGVTWNCAAEFDSDLNTDISFIEEGAYMIFSKINSRAGGRWQIEFKTILPNCVILYNSGGLRGYDFLALEILDGMVTVKMARGQIFHNLRIDDGQWHKLLLIFSPSMIEVSVDGVAFNHRFADGSARFLDLSDLFYIGGIDADRRQRAFVKGVKAADSSLMGCLKPIEVDDRIFALPNASVTFGISPGCVWLYPCHTVLNKPPCVRGAECLQQGVNHFACKCDSGMCINREYAEKYKLYSKSSSQLELVALDPLTVSEGGTTLISQQNINFILDHHKYGVRPSGVTLHVVQAPHFGRITVDTLPRSSEDFTPYDDDRRSKQIFSLADLASEKVRYTHDGSENHQDSMVIEMELIPEARFTLPSYLQGQYSFALHVNITPMNDPPLLLLLPGKTLKIIQGSKKIITSDIMRAEDPDTPPIDLIFTVIYEANSHTFGHIELNGHPADSFSQKDIDAGLVSFAMTSANKRVADTKSVNLTVQVSDGIEMSEPTIFTISIVPIELRMLNNSGLFLVHHSHAAITTDNLTFTTNGEDASVTIRYDVVRPPQYGIIELLNSVTSSWDAVETFTSQNISRGHVRYTHLFGNATHDSFKFRAAVGDVVTNANFEFRLTFIRLELFQYTNEELLLNSTREAILTPQYLRFETKPISVSSDKIKFVLLQPPKYGVLRISSSEHPLHELDYFTQYHINTGQLFYRLHRRAYSHIQDNFIFDVQALDCKNITGLMSIKHILGNDQQQHHSIELLKNFDVLKVNESGKAVITPKHLSFNIKRMTNLFFNITQLPQHGIVQVEERQNALRSNATYFSLHELISNSVYYVHDDSESRNDSFHFMVLSSELEDFQYVGVFRVEVILRNDNSPKRLSDNVFHIVFNGTRLITPKDLCYYDVDLDTRPIDIIYTIRSVSNGEVLRADKPTERITQFSQDDIINDLVLLRHYGDEYGKMLLWISDGLFDVDGVMEIHASQPFVRMLHTNGSIVESGKSVLITPNDFSVDTNMNCQDEDIWYEITKRPSFGSIDIIDSGNVFTQLDISAGRIVYRHSKSHTSFDSFSFKVSCKESWGSGEYPIKIYPSSYWEPLKLMTNTPFYIQESTTRVMTRNYLEVIHPENDSNLIIYTVIRNPQNGWLERINDTKMDPNVEQKLSQFDQTSINNNRIVYVHLGSNTSRDKLTMDVTNGIVSLKNIHLDIVVIPRQFFVTCHNLTVAEGGSITLKSLHFYILTDYFRGRVTDYKVLAPPQHGTIQIKGQDDLGFTLLNLNSNTVQYVHDNSESRHDVFTLVAMASDKKSEPIVVHVNIDPVNDEPPYVAVNTGLCVWEKGTFTFTRKELYVTDLDSPNENLTISVINSQSGYIVLKENQEEKAYQFTQNDIDQGNVLFKHTDGTKGIMIFNVSDGVNMLSNISFFITSKPAYTALIKNEKLTVFPFSRMAITDSILMSKCSDYSRGIKYVVKKFPNIGRLITISGNSHHHKSVQEFTQKDLNESLIFYEHTHQFSGLYADDSFSFDIETAHVKTIVNQDFKIQISISAGDLTKYIVKPRLKVQEGDRIALHVNISDAVLLLENQAGLREPKVEIQFSRPKHGKLIPQSAYFSQNEVESGLTYYQHDHSDTLADTIKMSIFLLPEHVLLCNDTISVTIIPINDQPFVLLTSSPKISVVQGENYTITKDDLYTEDNDTAPSDIIYDVINGPKEGRIFMIDSRNLSNKMVHINKFTQQDINDLRIVYAHSGIMKKLDFYFRVWDGNSKPDYKLFNIDILPIYLNVSSKSIAQLQQGSNTVILTVENVKLITNVHTSKVKYKVMKRPAHGMLYHKEATVDQFTHMILEDKSLLYMQHDMKAINDSFNLIAFVNSEIISLPFTIQIKVHPLMTIEDLKLVQKDPTEIPLAVMDASKLAKLTNDNPCYRIVDKPKYGIVQRIIRSSDEFGYVSVRSVTSFTHDDIKSGTIYYVPNKTNVYITGWEDGFNFLLAASFFQPALGKLKIILGNAEINDVHEPKEPESHGEIAMSGSHRTLYFLLTALILAAVIIATIVIGLLKSRCIIMSKKDVSLGKFHIQNQGSIAPIPLPRPPDDLITFPVSMMAGSKPVALSDCSMHSGMTTPVATRGNMPQCKVIPLLDAVAAAQQADINSRYTFGRKEPSDREDWSSCEASEHMHSVKSATELAANLMLRRNQYWV